MKTKNYIYCLAMLIATCYSCTEDWLKPNQPSALDSENGYSTVAGMQGLNNLLCKGLRIEVMGRGCNMQRAYEGSDLAVLVNGSPRDYDSEMHPTYGVPKDLWDYFYKQVSYAAVMISRADKVDASQEKKDEIQATGYFFLAYWYYRLITTYGDVPLITEETTAPKLDFQTSTQRRIIATMIPYMEFAVNHLPVTVPSGQVNKAAGYMLLTKYYLMAGQFEDAYNSATKVIEYPGLKLMKNRFGALAGANNPKIPNPNVMTDLFYKYNASDPGNTEKILIVEDFPGINGSTSGGERMREFLVEWYRNNTDNSGGTGLWGTGNGADATIDGKEGGFGPLGDAADLQILWTGRGIGRSKKTVYFNHEIWDGNAFVNDMRHTAPNWYPMETLVYNRKGTGVYGQHLKRENCKDTLRGWDDIVYNKTVVDDETRLPDNYNLMGGYMNWYIYRLAEAYLMRAEALVWMNRGSEATADINEIRRRAGAQEMTGAATLDDVLDERARELFLEEFRRNELVRISYTKAILGQDGYSLSTIGNKNWYYDRMKKKNNIYFDTNSGAARNFEYNGRLYRMSAFHIYFPIPESAINDNKLARINQNYGYTGYELNVPPVDIE